MICDEKTGEVLETLEDKSETGKARPWKEKKNNTTKLAEAYAVFDEKKAERVKSCGTYLEFSSEVNGDKRTLTKSNFCHVRLCPMCGWRRSLKIFSQMTAIMDYAEKEKQYQYLFLTLTVKNCSGAELEDTIKKMMKAWDRFCKKKAVADTVLGWYRGLEVTHNLDKSNKDYDTYHPHFHVVLMVSKSYFQGKYYIKQEEWKEFWKSAMRLEYDPQVDVRKVKGNTAKAIAEIAKYTVKDNDYLIDEDFDLTVETVKILDKALARKRLVAFGGRFKDIHKLLNLDDAVDGDLVHVEAEEKSNDDEIRKIAYFWHVGYRQYIKKRDIITKKKPVFD